MCMGLSEDKKWEMLQQALGAGARGDEPPMLVSKRTLFGIRSSIEEQMDAIAAEMEAKGRPRDGDGDAR